MRWIQITGFMFVMLIFSFGCNEKINNQNKKIQVNNETDSITKDWISKNHPICDGFNKVTKIFPEQEITQCIERAFLEQSNNSHFKMSNNLADNLVRKLVSQNPPKNLLTKVLKLISYHYASNASLVSLLIENGAKTSDLSLKLVRDGNSSACETSMIILKNNRELYKNSLSVGSYLPNITDLHHQVDSRSHRLICPEVAKELISYNPNALNAIDEYGNTPLHYMLLDFSAASRDLELAKLLMTKENINKQTLNGNTPLHELLKHSFPDKKDAELVKAIIEKGGNLTLKNKEGITVKDYVNKRLDIKKALKE